MSLPLYAAGAYPPDDLHAIGEIPGGATIAPRQNLSFRCTLGETARIRQNL